MAVGEHAGISCSLRSDELTEDDLPERIRQFQPAFRSAPSGDGPAPHDEGVVVLYERLVLLALAENALAKQQGASKARKAS